MRTIRVFIILATVLIEASVMTRITTAATPSTCCTGDDQCEDGNTCCFAQAGDGSVCSIIQPGFCATTCNIGGDQEGSAPVAP